MTRIDDPAARATIAVELDEHVAVIGDARDELLAGAAAAAQRILAALDAGGTVYTLGNGGSAADAQHLAAELLGHFGAERPPLRAHALTTDASTLTAIANDYAFEQVFSRQLVALATESDVVVAFTTSGRSPNVANALATARERGASTVLFSGGDGGPAAADADVAVIVPSSTTARVQEVHLLALHLVCRLVDDALAGAR